MYEPDPPAGGSLKAAYCSGVTAYGSVRSTNGAIAAAAKRLPTITRPSS